MTKGDIAKQNFLSGLNCAQAVVLAFKDEIGLEEETLKNLSVGFGGGFARLRLICGAVSGINMVISAISKEDKGRVYALVREASDRFKKQAGSIICGELLSGVDGVTNGAVPQERTEEYYKKRPCYELCKLAGDVAEEILKENGYL